VTALSQEQTGLELAQLEENEQQAWQAYVKSLGGLTGAAYYDSEDSEWERLTRKLKEIEGRRAEIGRSTKTR